MEKELTITKKSTFKCEFCDRDFESKSLRTSHKIRFHRDKMTSTKLRQLSATNVQAASHGPSSSQGQAAPHGKSASTEPAVSNKQQYQIVGDGSKKQRILCWIAIFLPQSITEFLRIRRDYLC